MRTMLATMSGGRQAGRLRASRAARRSNPNPMKIKSDKKWHEFLDRSEVPAKVLKSEFDWTDEDEFDHFIKYKQNYYHLSQFETVKMPGWDGAIPQSYFSGLLIKLSPDHQQYKIAYYYE